MRIQQQYGNGSNLKFTLNGKVPFDPIPHSDSNGFISAKAYKPLTSYKKKQLKKIMRGLEWSAAVVPDSVATHDGTVDSIYMNHFKIEYIEKHHLKTDRMLLLDTMKVINE